jgi:hypothetical protein
MASTSTASRRKKAARAAAAKSPARILGPALIILFFLLCIFLVPYHIPISIPSNSQSWEFGYNNTAAQLLIALMLLALFAWQYFFGGDRLDDDPIARTLVDESGLGWSRVLLMTMVILQVITCAIVLGWYSLLPTTRYGEFTYFIQRISVALLGRAPYVDFAFDYGPALIALPVGIYRLFHGAMSIEAAYITAVVVNYVIGFALAAYILSQLNARGRVVIFVMLGIEFANLSMGLQYTPLRFTIALASLFAIRHIHRATADNPRQRAILLGAAALLLPLVTLSISPEMGIALCIGLCAYFLWFLPGPERGMAVYVLPSLAGVAVSALVLPRPYFHSILSFGKGSGSFPIFPTVHIIAFLALAIWVFPRLGIIAVRERSAAGPFCAGLAFLCGLLILPATGRCDSGHIWNNSIGIIIIGLSAVTWLKQVWQYTAWAIYFVMFPLADKISFWDHYQAPMENALQIRQALQSVPYSPDNYAHVTPGSPLPPVHFSKLLPMGPWAQRFPGEVKIGLPLGGDETLEDYLLLTGRNIPEYFMPPYSDAADEADLQRKYKEMESMEYIYVPMYFLNYLRPANRTAQMEQQGEADSKFLTGLLLFPVNLPAIHPLFDPNREVMRHIAEHYGLVKQYPDGVLLRRRSAEP